MSSVPDSRLRQTVLSFLKTVDPGDTETVDILTQKFKSKPYHAIMRIVLFYWPMNCRQAVAKELLELKAAMRSSESASMAIALQLTQSSIHTSLIWNNLDAGTYYEYISRHKSYVTRGFELFNNIVTDSVKKRLLQENLLLEVYKPDEDPTDEQIAEHDDSKYTVVETVTYAMKWYPLPHLGSCDEDAWETGMQHHYCHNKHHPEHWGTDHMHWRYIVEALYDMAAMELERRFHGKEPEDKAKLLEFDPRFLERFDKTGQLEFAKKLIGYTIEEYARLHTAKASPSQLESAD